MGNQERSDKRSPKIRRNNRKGRKMDTAGDHDTRRYPDRTHRYEAKDNDVAWYTASPQLLKDVASIPFGFASGIPFKLDEAVNQQIVFPGVMAIYNAPAPGISTSQHSRVAPINIAAQKIFSFVRKSNAGGTNYDVPDLMLYLMAMDSAYAYAAYMMRVYGVMNSYNQQNRYIPDGLLKAMGINVGIGGISTTYIKTHIAEFRAFINMYVMRLNSFCVPNDIKYFQRHFWMYSGVYKDEDVAKAQFYMYVPAYLYKYAIDSQTSAGKLETLAVAMNWSDSNGWQVNSGGLGMNNIITIGRDIIESLMYQQDIAIMSGDILKAYGEGSLMRLNQIDEALRIEPSFSEEVLSQIHNTSFVGTKFVNSSGTLDKTVCDITQLTDIGTGDLIFNPKVIWGGGNHHKKILDLWKQDVSPEDVMVATRNKVVTSTPDANNVSEIVSCGSDIALACLICSYDFVGNQMQLYDIYDGSVAHTSVEDLLPVNAGVFNERPIRIIYSLDLEGHKMPTFIDGEIANFSIMSNNDLEEMHEVALLSMFGVPYLP